MLQVRNYIKEINGSQTGKNEKEYQSYVPAINFVG